MKSFTLACFLGFIFLLLASLFVANAAPADAPKKPSEKPVVKQIQATGKMLVAEREKAGKKTRREFPLMFDIADRSVKHRAKQKQK